jgi:hypothetical protein
MQHRPEWLSGAVLVVRRSELEPPREALAEPDRAAASTAHRDAPVSMSSRTPRIAASLAPCKMAAWLMWTYVGPLQGRRVAGLSGARCDVGHVCRPCAARRPHAFNARHRVNEGQGGMAEPDQRWSTRGDRTRPAGQPVTRPREHAPADHDVGRAMPAAAGPDCPRAAPVNYGAGDPV